jgi:F0F1-type ATP synthase assembly protein I
MLIYAIKGVNMKVNYSGKVIGAVINSTAWIVGPVLVGVMVGNWLDQKYNTEPWLFLTSVGVCFIISMFGLIRSALAEFKNIEKENKSSEKE